MSIERFMQTFGFDQYDLLANQGGELTERQRERVAATHQQYRRGVWPTFAMIGGIMVVGSVVAVASGDTSFDELLRGLPIAGALIFGMMGVSVIGGHFMTSDLRQGRIRTSAGKAKLLSGKARGMPYYRVRIGQHTFNLMNEQQFQCFEQGKAYRMWYVPYWPDVILSVEPLADFV